MKLESASREGEVRGTRVVWNASLVPPVSVAAGLVAGDMGLYDLWDGVSWTGGRRAAENIIVVVVLSPLLSPWSAPEAAILRTDSWSIAE